MADKTAGRAQPIRRTKGAAPVANPNGNRAERRRAEQTADKGAPDPDAVMVQGVLRASGQPMTTELLDGAMFTVFLESNWYWVTRQMTTEQKEAAAAAVRRHQQHQPGDDELRDNPDGDRHLFWWREEYRYNAHGVDTWRIANHAVVQVEHPKIGRRLADVHRKDSAHMVVVIDQAGETHLLGTDRVVEVIRSPVDAVLELMAAGDTSKGSGS